MSISIQTNANSLVAQQNLNTINQFQSTTIQQLTSGYRINQAGDDAAGLAVANQFTNSISELTQGVANGNNGVAQLQIMDGGMSNISQILDRLQTLATQSASGTFTGDRSTLNTEFQTDLQEIDRQAQSIGLNAGGEFDQNLSVYLGEGSGSTSLSNGVVTLALAGSSVDSQSLGLKGMEAVNLTSGSLSGTNAGTDLGPSSATSVQNIVSNTSGGNPNQEAVAGYAQVYFSGAGFSDAGKIGVSVNLAGVTDTATLATAINSAIQAAANGTTSAAAAFKNAGIVASVHTDTQGGQELAFSSSTTAFQVQAGDQMANALLGNVTNVGTATNPIAQGTAVAATAATTVTGANTSTGSGFQAGQAVNMVITGGGLASAVTLNLNTTNAVPTSAAIATLENQFSGNAALAAAGLSMGGSTTTGSPLSFTSATGQSFNVQVTGDTANLLGLGSFLAGNQGQTSYSTVTAGSAYNDAAVTGAVTGAGVPTTTAVAAGLEVSINGGASTALTPIDLTSGASATAASVSTGIINPTNITSANDVLNITVTNNGVSTAATPIDLNINQAATAAAAVGTITESGYSPVTVSAASLNNQFTASLNGGATKTVTIADGTYSTAANYLQAVQNGLNAQFGAGAVTASWATVAGQQTGALTLTDNTGTTGLISSLSIGAATTNTSGSIASTVAGLQGGTNFAGLTTTANNNAFMVSLNGAAAQTVTLGNTAYAAGATGAGNFLLALNSALQSTFGQTGGQNNVSASFANGGTGELTLTSLATGANSSVAVSAATYNTHAVAVSSALGPGAGSGNLTSPITVSALDNNNKFTISVDGGASSTVTIADGTYSTGANLVAAMSGVPAGVTASFNTQTGELNFTSTGATTGTADTISIGSVTQATAGSVASTTMTQTNSGSVTVASAADEFAVTLNGAASPVTVSVADASYSSATDFLAAVQSGLDSALGTGTVHAGWDAATGALTLTSATAGAGSSIAISAVSDNTGNVAFGLGTASGTGSNAAANTGVASAGLTATQSASPIKGATVNNGGLSLVGLSSSPAATQGQTNAANSGLTNILGAGTTAALTRGLADTPDTAEGIANTIKTALGANAVVTLSDTGVITIASASKGANSAVTVSAGSANSALGLPAAAQPVVALGQNMNAADLVANLNAQFAANATFQAAGLHAAATLANGTGSGNFITISSSNGTQFRLNALGGGATSAENVGFGTAGTSFTAAALSGAGANPTSTGTAMATLSAQGVSNSGALSFTAMQYGDDKQALTFSAMDSSGVLETKTITLANNAATNTAGNNINSAVAYINQQLQASTGTPALQQIAAVTQNVSGQEEINFVSSLSNFTVGVGGTANADGLHGGVATQVTSQSNGSGANMSIDTQANAEAAVTAVTTAVSKLGTAQAAVGIGENQLNYAINLASSQITNYSAAESQIRDANVAQQAANLTKAQVLQQAAIAAMAQANTVPQAVLKLLQG